MTDSRPCKRCRRILTKRESIERGYGNVCWSKVDSGLPILSNSVRGNKSATIMLHYSTIPEVI